MLTAAAAGSSAHALCAATSPPPSVEIRPLNPPPFLCPQAHASAAIVNFSENCEQDMMQPYLDDLIGKLLALLQRGQKVVQVGAGTCLTFPRPLGSARALGHPPTPPSHA